MVDGPDSAGRIQRRDEAIARLHAHPAYGPFLECQALCRTIDNVFKLNFGDLLGLLEAEAKNWLSWCRTPTSPMSGTDSKCW
jgi:hypothetical protein